MSQNADWAAYAIMAEVLSDFGTALGSLAALIALPAVLWSWWIARQSAYRTQVYAIVHEMLNVHREVVASLSVGDLKGREVFAAMLREFTAIYRIVSRISQSQGRAWSTAEKIDIAYTFLFFGPTYTCWAELERYDTQAVRDISVEISRLKTSFQKKRLFLGHQNRLSNYYRNLYASYDFIDKTSLSSVEKLTIAKLFRTQLTNYEQALLAYNSLSRYGAAWIRSGILGEYQLIKNLPRLFSELDSHITFKDLFPYIYFEWEGHNNIVADLKKYHLGKYRVYVQKCTNDLS